jgi:thiamine pyrophosphokinase
MKGVLIIGGEAPSLETVRHEIVNAEIIICADSGFDTALDMGLAPDIIIGDMDSIRNKTRLNELSENKVLRYSEYKDETDTELGIKYLRDNSFDEIIIVGGGGGRMDHFLGIVFLFDREFPPDIWYTHDTRFQKISGYNIIPSRKGDLVSFYPAGKSVCRMKSTGLKWPLDNLLWSKGDIGISNIVTEDPFTITMLEGRLIMINQIKDTE